MGGKLPIIGIVAFGFVAALSAALIMASLRADPGEQEAAAATTRTVLVAARDLPAMTRLTEDDVAEREVDLDSVPNAHLGDPVLVVGRFLKTAHAKGQPVTERSLVVDETGALLAGSLPEGMRAVSIELPSSSAMRGLLYPGSRVDVISSKANRFAAARPGQEQSRTLLQNVQVLAVEDRTMFTPEPSEEGEEGVVAPRRANNAKGITVTLLVDPQQAREIQAAREAGELSLALRNPLDSTLTSDPQSGDDEPPAEIVAEPEPWRTVVIRGDETETKDFNAEPGQPEPVQQTNAQPTGPVPEIDN